MSIYDLVEPIQRRFRTARMKQMIAIFGLSDATRVLDVGGLEYNWTLIPQQPSVTLVNIGIESRNVNARFRRVIADARSLPFKDLAFDIAYSNSVIEHVGTLADQMRFAAEIRRVAPSYYVQTPNRDFFLEPHVFGPFVHLLPRQLQIPFVRYGSAWGIVQKPDREAIESLLDSLHLLNRAEFQRLFPDAVIHEETFMGMSKSFIAVRT